MLYWVAVFVEGSWDDSKVSCVGCIFELMVALDGHVSSLGIAGVSDGDELSSLMVVELNIAVFSIADVLYGMGSGELGIATFSVGEVVELSEVEEESFLDWLSVFVEFSWDESN